MRLQPHPRKKKLADFKHLLPKAIIWDNGPLLVNHEKPKGVINEAELRGLRADHPELNLMIIQASQKATDSPGEITNEEFSWLHPNEQVAVRDWGLSNHSAEQIKQANVSFNDHLKLTIVDLAKKAEPRKRDQLIELLRQDLEGIKNVDGGVLQAKDVNDSEYHPDFNLIQLKLAKVGLHLGEGELAKFAGAERNIVNWAASAGPAALPDKTQSPLAFRDLSF